MTPAEMRKAIVAAIGAFVGLVLEIWGEDLGLTGKAETILQLVALIATPIAVYVVPNDPPASGTRGVQGGSGIPPYVGPSDPTRPGGSLFSALRVHAFVPLALLIALGACASNPGGPPMTAQQASQQTALKTTKTACTVYTRALNPFALRISEGKVSDADMRAWEEIYQPLFAEYCTPGKTVDAVTLADLEAKAYEFAGLGE